MESGTTMVNLSMLETKEMLNVIKYRLRIRECQNHADFCIPKQAVKFGHNHHEQCPNNQHLVDGYYLQKEKVL